MSATNERNEQVREILDYLYNKAVDDSVKIDESAYKGSLEKLFSTTAWGFREILISFQSFQGCFFPYVFYNCFGYCLCHFTRNSIANLRIYHSFISTKNIVIRK